MKSKIRPTIHVAVDMYIRIIGIREEMNKPNSILLSSFLAKEGSRLNPIDSLSGMFRFRLLVI